MNLILANQGAFDHWQVKVRSTAELRLVQASNYASSPNSGMFDQWWESVKSKAEGGEFRRVGSTAVIDCHGALDYKYSIWSWLYDSSCYLGIQSKVKAAEDDSGIDKIVLTIDSPGGTHHGLLEASNAIWSARESGKEVVAVVDPEAASAGYWLASQSNRIVAIESGWVGSLGSQSMLYSMKRMYDEEGVDIEVIRASISPKKNQGIPYEAITDAAREERQGWVNMAGEQFIEHVMRGRGKTRSQILDNYGQGMMFFTPEAKSRGMIDEIGSLQSELVANPSENGSGSSSSTKRRRVGSFLDLGTF